jgi:penicillin-binding protein 1A
MTEYKYRKQFFTALKAAGVFFLALLLAAGITVCYLILTAPDIDSVQVSPAESATYIYDQDGNQLRKLSLASSNRDIISLEDIPLSLQYAVIAIEDERFYSHGGIDVRGIARAFWNGLANGGFSEGASTITQQLIKNSVFTEWTQEDSFFDRLRRKVQEQYLALRLEDTMSKEEILEDYLNTINLGAGCYGVQAAAQRYFGKDVSELSLSESAVLAAIPQNPTGFNPITFPEENNSRRTTILSYMEEQGYITSKEHAAALEDPVYDRIREHDAAYEEPSVYSYYEDALINQVIEVLMEEMNCTKDQARQAVYSGGLRIISAQNQEIQKICDEEFSNPDNFPDNTQYGIDYALTVSDADGNVTNYGQEELRCFVKEYYDASFNLMCSDPDTAQMYVDAFRMSILGTEEDTLDSSADANDNDIPDDSSDVTDNSNLEVLSERLTLSPQPQASVVIIDQETGFVQAIVGGRGEKTASLTLNRATDTTRQPGSTFKILTAYAPALDACSQTLATLYDNEPYTYQDGTPVSNWDLNDYSGLTTIRDAIVRSINVVAVKCLTEISPQLGYEYAEKFGITTLQSSDLVQPLALGGITQGVTNLELCAAYAAIADGGIYRTPRFFTQIYDRNGNLLIDYTANGTRILSSSTASLLTDAMQDVVTSPDGTAFGAISAGSCPVAGKTGTTSNYKDIWFVGYTPYYTCSIWGGYDNNESLPDQSTCHTYNKVLWTAIMTRIHESLPSASFEVSEDVNSVTLCSQSNLLAVSDGCPETYQELFTKDTVPTDFCQLHEPVPETEPVLIYQDFLTNETESPPIDDQTQTNSLDDILEQLNRYHLY